MMRKIRIWKCGCLGLVALLLVALIGASYYMIDYALAPEPDRENVARWQQEFLANHPESREWLDSMLTTKTLRDTFLVMPSGERHHALLATHPSGGQRVAMVLHGWRCSSVTMLHYAQFFYQQLGCHILLPDLHAHGLSEGRRIGMGWKERFDVIRWMVLAKSEFKADSLILHGVSMGAATAMNVAGEHLPDGFSKVWFIEDCGYTSVWDELSGQLAEEFSLPPFPLLYTSSLLSRLLNGWSFGEASSLRQVAKSQLPMLFIHGDADTFVPTQMVYPLYEAKQGEKRLWITHGAEHAESIKLYPEAYVDTVRRFVFE